MWKYIITLIGFISISVDCDGLYKTILFLNPENHFQNLCNKYRIYLLVTDTYINLYIVNDLYNI